MSSKSLTVLVLAAGHGTRMKSHTLKLLHHAAGLPLVDHVRLVAESLKPQQIRFIIGPGMDDLEQSVLPHKSTVQSPAKGTGHAVQVGMDALGVLDGIVLVMLGDCPLVTKEDAQKLIAALDDESVDAAFLAAHLAQPFGYGRMVVENGVLTRIVEETEASAAEKEITLINSGLVALRAPQLTQYLAQLNDKNNKGELYLTDLPALIAKAGRKAVVAVTSANHVLGVNTRANLAAVEFVLQNRLRNKALDQGVTLRDPDSIYLSMDTVFAKDVTIEPNVVIGNGVVLHENVTIRAFSHIEDAELHNGVSVGPFARIRGGAVLEDNASIGNFVEVKNTRMGKAAKAAHLSYLGDSDIGSGANIGAGTITCNYDGFAKHKTVIGNNAFIGSNSTLVAPVTVGKGAFTAAGSAITQDVPDDALALARARQDIKTGWAAKRRKDKGK